mmetsp:Transcript_113550/g.321935  ORF Transcript_113550/g.321935 Transcript_113550/m.321935 type:complete len:272 (-) Transcript_113550:376-1191(-)
MVVRLVGLQLAELLRTVGEVAPVAQSALAILPAGAYPGLEPAHVEVGIVAVPALLLGARPLLVPPLLHPLLLDLADLVGLLPHQVLGHRGAVRGALDHADLVVGARRGVVVRGLLEAYIALGLGCYLLDVRTAGANHLADQRLGHLHQVHGERLVGVGGVRVQERHLVQFLLHKVMRGLQLVLWAVDHADLLVGILVRVELRGLPDSDAAATVHRHLLEVPALRTDELHDALPRHLHGPGLPLGGLLEPVCCVPVVRQLGHLLPDHLLGMR